MAKSLLKDADYNTVDGITECITKLQINNFSSITE